jgi:hypothetical protein
MEKVQHQPCLTKHQRDGAVLAEKRHGLAPAANPISPSVTVAANTVNALYESATAHEMCVNI